MKDKILILKNEINEKINKSTSIDEINQINLEYFTKKGIFSQLMLSLKDVDPKDKPEIGKLINDTKNELLNSLDIKTNEFNNILLQEKLKSEKIDINLSATKLNLGSKHPLNIACEKVVKHFISKGYEIVNGPELELDKYNFEMMNIPKDHPARAMQDTFYIDAQRLLRTHTSPVQARKMLDSNSKPLKIICPGKVYRRDEDDQTHSHQFMQIEGLVIGKNISFANLKNTLEELLYDIFEGSNSIRMRPSYFPFTEPSVEVDVLYRFKNGDTKYIEMLGAGMVHPDVLKMGGYDSEIFSGFAFGIGVERLAMIKFEIDDIRYIYENDIRFLQQFKGDI